MVLQAERAHLRAQFGLARAATQQVQVHRCVGSRLQQLTERSDDDMDAVVVVPGAKASDAETGLGGPRHGVEARGVCAPMNSHRGSTEAVRVDGRDEIQRIASDEVGSPERPARQPTQQGVAARRHQQIAAPGRHHQRVAVAARCQRAVGGDVVGVHEVRRQILQVPARGADAQQPVDRAHHRRQHTLFDAVDGLRASRQHRNTPAAGQHRLSPAAQVHAIGIAQQAQMPLHRCNQRSRHWRRKRASSPVSARRSKAATLAAGAAAGAGAACIICCSAAAMACGCVSSATQPRPCWRSSCAASPASSPSSSSGRAVRRY